jgi:hypothetical protein
MAAGTYSSDQPAFAPPAADHELGLLVYRVQTDGSGRSRIEGRFLRSSGCPSPLPPLDAPFIIDEPADGSILTFPRAVAFGDNVFVVVWTELRSTLPALRSRLRARVVQGTQGLAPIFLETVRSPTGQSADLVTEGDNVTLAGAALVRVGETTLAAVWNEGGAGARRTRFGVFDDHLGEVVPPRTLGEVIGFDLYVDDGPALAFDGTQLLAAFVQRLPTGEARAFGRFLDPSGRSLSSPDSPDGQPFRLGESDTGVESAVSVAPLPGGGFLAAWQEDATEGGAVVARAVAFEADGRRRFSNRACDRRPFDLALDPTARQWRPAVALTAGGAITLVWTSDGSAIDRSGTGIRGAVLEPRDLFAGGPGDRDLTDRLVAEDAGPGSACVAPGSQPDFGACSCATDCAEGVNCLAELPLGVPHGICARPCATDLECGASGRCSAGPATGGTGTCLRTCLRSEECGPYGVCDSDGDVAGSCQRLCQAHDDCLSGHCNAWSGRCTDGGPIEGAGVGEACVRDSDCRSDICGSYGVCVTPCSVERQLCPDGAACVTTSADNDYGICMLRCETDDDCGRAELTCGDWPYPAARICLTR